jgi:predicted GIY-YIG superfamily endonuclease
MSETNVYQVYVIRNAAGKFYIGLSEMFKSGCNNTTKAFQNGRGIADHGRWCG